MLVHRKAYSLLLISFLFQNGYALTPLPAPMQATPESKSASCLLLSLMILFPLLCAYWAGGIHNISSRTAANSQDQNNVAPSMELIQQDFINVSLLLSSLLLGLCAMDLQELRRWRNFMAGMGCAFCGSAHTCCMMLLNDQPTCTM
mmetsp:Transcript_46987/g.147224  ORF Transcript_46987/g.147224 Transcript_46987/m.147224 type:complete len:146 (-) Transcript_46987:69-506(-)